MAYKVYAGAGGAQFRGKTPMPVVVVEYLGDPPTTNTATRTQAVGPAATEAIPYSPTRQGFLIQNLGPDPVYFGFDASVLPAVGAPGINKGRLLAAGDTLSGTDLPGYRGSIYVVVDVADSADISILEWD